MAGGLVALLDDIATMAKMAAASADDIAAAAGRASAKAAGVVVDDTAVTPQYLHGMDPSRELPIIKRIAIGSIKNKLLIILPIALILSQFVPWLLTPILMVGATYLCYEGAEKVYEKLFHKPSGHEVPVVEIGEDAEKVLVRQAVTTDLILSAEIMVIALNEVASEGFAARTAILVVVALAITLLVYGFVALLVKMDDIGLHLLERSQGRSVAGKLLVEGMPKLLTLISVVGTLAMLWVGGHIILVGLDEIGWHAPYDLVHYLEGGPAGVPGIGGLLGWLTNTFFSLLLGLFWGMVIVGVMHVIPRRKRVEAADPVH